MSFLNFGLLWLLPLLAVPILLHLLVFPRLRTIDLPTFRFLMDSYVYQRRKLKFLEALLAALRALFIAVLILSFCRPLIDPVQSWLGGGSNRNVAVLVDASASMNASSGGASAMARAKNHIKTLVDRLGPNDRLSLIRFDASGNEVFSQYVSNREAIKRIVDDLEPSPARGNVLAGWSTLFSSDASTSGRDLVSGASQVHLISDFQANGWKEVGEQNGLRRIPTNLSVNVVDVGSSKMAGNQAVIGDAPKRNRAIVGLPIEFTAKVANRSSEEFTNAILHIFVNDKETARYPLSLKPGEIVVKKIIHIPSEPGLLRGRFEISGKSQDSFPDDDRFLFALNVSEKVRVLLVNGKPDNHDRFNDEALYLRAAMAAQSMQEARTASQKNAAEKAASATPKSDPTEEEDLARALEVKEINEYELHKREDLDQFAVIILANCSAFGADRYDWMRDFVRKGGGLIVFPGDRTNHGSYNDQFWVAPNESKERFIDLDFGPPQGEIDKAETLERLAGIDPSHPALAVFDERDARYFRSIAVFRRFVIKPVGDGARLWTFARFSSGTPALVEQKIGEGLVIVSAFPASATWSNLPLKPEFMPLILRLIGHARKAPDLDNPSSVAPGAVAEIRVSPDWASATAKVTDPKKKSRPLTFQRDGPKAVSAYDATREAGFHEIEVRDAGSDPPKVAQGGFAINLDPEESEFRKISESQIRDWLPGASLAMIDATAERMKLDGPSKPGNPTEIWRWLIYLLFGVIAVEFVLATLSGGDPNQGVLKE